MGYKMNIGESHMPKPRRIIEDIYKSTEVKGSNAPVQPHPVIRSGPKPKNQFGENRTLTGGKGKK